MLPITIQNSLIKSQEINEDVINLAAIINAECGICDSLEQYLTGSVVLNRMDSDKYPDSMIGVLEEPNQFDGYNTPSFRPTVATLNVALNLLHGKGRDTTIIYFYARDSPNKIFKKNINKFVKYKLKYHNYATCEN